MRTATFAPSATRPRRLARGRLQRFLLAPGALHRGERGAHAPEGAGPLEDLAYWADGYLRSRDKIASFSTPEPSHSFNRSDGAMTITKVAGTTGR